VVSIVFVISGSALFNGRYSENIARDRADGFKIGIQGVPFFIVNDTIARHLKRLPNQEVGFFLQKEKLPDSMRSWFR
jgi:hypothetical protein